MGGNVDKCVTEALKCTIAQIYCMSEEILIHNDLSFNSYPFIQSKKILRVIKKNYLKMQVYYQNMY